MAAPSFLSHHASHLRNGALHLASSVRRGSASAGPAGGHHLRKLLGWKKTPFHFSKPVKKGRETGAGGGGGRGGRRQGGGVPETRREGGRASDFMGTTEMGGWRNRFGEDGPGGRGKQRAAYVLPGGERQVGGTDERRLLTFAAQKRNRRLTEVRRGIAVRGVDVGWGGRGREVFSARQDLLQIFDAGSRRGHAPGGCIPYPHFVAPLPENRSPPLFILCGGLLVFPLALIGCPSPPLYLSERSGRRSEQGRRPPSSAPHRGGAGD